MGMMMMDDDNGGGCDDVDGGVGGWVNYDTSYCDSWSIIMIVMMLGTGLMTVLNYTGN